jgi:sulfatase maturation enzyme AslB (radical SAM superfamily)
VLEEKYNEVFKKYFHEVDEITEDDGSVSTIKFRGWDFRVSNKCNFKCRMCVSDLSSSINEENKKYKINHYFEDNIISNSKYMNISEFVEKYSDDFELIEFAGGETLLMDEQYELLEYLIENNKTHINLWYNTNMSVLKYKDKSILDYWRKWDPKNLTVIASIDEIEDRSEYLRKGTNWNIVERNLNILSKEEFNRSTNITVTCFNVYRLPEIITHLVNIDHISEKYDYSNFMLSFEMDKFHISVLPKDFRSQIKSKILTFIQDFEFKYKINLQNKFIHILKELDSDMKEDKLKLLLKETLQMDKIRNESMLKTFPELIVLLDHFRK